MQHEFKQFAKPDEILFLRSQLKSLVRLNASFQQ